MVLVHRHTCARTQCKVFNFYFVNHNMCLCETRFFIQVTDGAWVRMGLMAPGGSLCPRGDSGPQLGDHC